MDILKELYSLRDEKYKTFSKSLIPNVPNENIIGVRTPDLKALAKKITSQGMGENFCRSLPHRYFEENQLHSFIISQVKDYDKLIMLIDEFLPYVDNWAVCDQLRPVIFKKHRDRLIDSIKIWINSDRIYTVRFGTGMLMCHYLDESFKPEYLELVSDIKSDEYYINMMSAWYFATALAKQYESAVVYLEKNMLSDFVHNKTIQKAVESYRVSDGHKIYLKTLRKSVKK
ncbi:MAG: DNA alkylation repair protein [Ruminococcus sp.]|nr:DNA alkylation repair protein [Ruminococcus sp.]